MRLCADYHAGPSKEYPIFFLFVYKAFCNCTRVVYCSGVLLPCRVIIYNHYLCIYLGLERVSGSPFLFVLDILSLIQPDSPPQKKKEERKRKDWKEKKEQEQGKKLHRVNIDNRLSIIRDVCLCAFFFPNSCSIICKRLMMDYLVLVFIPRRF